MWFEENKACNFFSIVLYGFYWLFFSPPVCFYKKNYTAILTDNTEKLWKSLFSVSGTINLTLWGFFCLFYDNFQVALQSSYFQGWFRQMHLIKFYKSLLCLFNLQTYHHIFIAKGIRSFLGQIQMLMGLVYHNRLLCSFWELLCNNRGSQCS